MHTRCIPSALHHGNLEILLTLEPAHSFSRRRINSSLNVNLCSLFTVGSTSPFHTGKPSEKINLSERLIAHASFFQFGARKPKLPDVVQAGDPVLHEMAAVVNREDIGSEEVERVISDMVKVMRNAPGVGLAAPQIGVPLQIILLEDTKELISYSSPEEVEVQERKPFDLMVVINPTLKPIGTKTAFFFEGCLSVNGYRGLVERHLEVEVSGLDRFGNPITVQARGWQARILQHEYDHLQGTLYVDKVTPRTFRTQENLRMPMAAGCPSAGTFSE